MKSSRDSSRLFARVRRATSRLLELDRNEMSRAQAALAYMIKLVRETSRELVRDKCLLHANALAYKTLLGLIPALVILSAFFSIFKSDAEKEKFFDFINDKIYPVNAQLEPGDPAPQPDSEDPVMAGRDQIRKSLQTFTDNATSVGAVGIAVLLVIVLLLMRTVEDSFNAIWGIKKNRPFLAQIAIYTAILVWMPFLAISSMGLTQYVHAKARKVEQKIAKADPGAETPAPAEGEKKSPGSETPEKAQDGWTSRWLFTYVMPYLIMFVVITSLYVLLPNTRVRIRPAMSGAALGAFLFELCTHGFTYYVAHATSYSRVYGTLGVIPVMLVWFYASWLIVLFGAEVSFTVQNFEDLTQKQDRMLRAERWRPYYAVRAVLEISRRFAAGGHPLTAVGLSEQFELPEYVMLEMLERLTEQGVLTRVQSSEATYVPARDIDRLTVKDVVDATTGGKLIAPTDTAHESALIAQIFSGARDASDEKLSARFRTLVQRIDDPASLETPRERAAAAPQPRQQHIRHGSGPFMKAKIVGASALERSGGDKPEGDAEPANAEPANDTPEPRAETAEEASSDRDAEAADASPSSLES